MSSTGQVGLSFAFIMSAVLASIGQILHPETSFLAKAAHLVRNIHPLASHYLPWLF